MPPAPSSAAAKASSSTCRTEHVSWRPALVTGPGREPRVRVGISGTHRTGKTPLAKALGARWPSYVTADEPYDLLEEEGSEFAFPPTPEDYRALLARSVQ